MADSPQTSVAAKIAAVHQRYEAARQQMRDAERMELEQLQQECGSAGHHWNGIKWLAMVAIARSATFKTLLPTE